MDHQTPDSQLRESLSWRSNKKILVNKVDADGFYIESVFFDVERDLPGDLITEPIPEGFYKPKWNGEVWIEGLSVEEIETMRNIPHEPSEVDILREENEQLKKRLESTELAVLTLLDFM